MVISGPNTLVRLLETDTSMSIMILSTLISNRVMELLRRFHH